MGNGPVMKKIIAWLVLLILTACSRATPEKILEIQGKNLFSSKPPFTLVSPSPFEFIHFSSVDYPDQNSLTRTYLWITKKENQAEEIFVVQIADRTNPQAEPITAPPLKPETEKRAYLMGQDRKGNLEVNYMIQLIVWNPDSSVLKPIKNKGLNIPSHWAFQGQILFVYQGEDAVFIRYLKDVNAFGLKVSEKGKDWEKGSISGNEKKVYEAFQKSFVEMMDSIQIKNP